VRLSGNYTLKHLRGATLLLAIIALSALSLFGLSLINLTISRIINVDLEIDKVKALYVAEAGIAKSLHELKKGLDPDGDGIGVIARSKFFEGTFEVTYNAALFTFTSIGRVNGVERLIQLKCVGG